MSRNKEFDQEVVLQKALNLFWERGYNACSMQELVSELGISRSSLYDTFKDKRTLFLMSLKAYKKKESNEIIAILEKTTDIKRTFYNILSFITEEVTSCETKKGCFMVNTTVELSQSDPEVAAILTESKQEMEKAFESALRRGQEAGQVPKDKDPELLSKYLYNNIAGLRVIARNNPPVEEIEGIVGIVLSTVFD